MARIKPEHVNGMWWRVIGRVGDNPKENRLFCDCRIMVCPAVLKVIFLP